MRVKLVSAPISIPVVYTAVCSKVAILRLIIYVDIYIVALWSLAIRLPTLISVFVAAALAWTTLACRCPAVLSSVYLRPPKCSPFTTSLFYFNELNTDDNSRTSRACIISF